MRSCGPFWIPGKPPPTLQIGVSTLAWVSRLGYYPLTVFMDVSKSQSILISFCNNSTQTFIYIKRPGLLTSLPSSVPPFSVFYFHSSFLVSFCKPSCSLTLSFSFGSEKDGLRSINRGNECPRSILFYRKDGWGGGKTCLCVKLHFECWSLQM